MWLGKWVLIWNLDSQRYTAADIVGTFFCVVSGGSAFGQIAPILKNVAEGKEAFKDLVQLLNRKKTLDEFKGGRKIKKIKQISLKSVTFSYKSLNDDQL
jgi:ABC-type bacteriocin/lantibiotic exporter with double-glycine peptidase domain